MFGCTDKVSKFDKNTEILLSYNVNMVDEKEYILCLSDLMESIEVIKLDNSTEEAFGRIWDIAISDNYIATANVGESVKLYNRKNGKFIGNIGRRGQGPGEYTNVWGITFNEADNRVYIWPNMKNYIYSYDINGNFIEKETIHLPDGIASRGTMFLNKQTNEMIVFITPYGSYQRRNTNFAEEKYICWTQDLQGNIKESISASNYIIPRNSSYSWASHTNHKSSIYSYALRTTNSNIRKDTLYHYNSKNNQLYPVYTTNFPHEENIVICSLESPLHYYTIHATYKKGYITNPENLEGCKILQVDKSTHKGRYIRMVNDYLGDIEIVLYDFLCSVKNDYSSIIYNPLDLKEQLEEALETNTNMSDEVRNRVLTMKNSLNENDNDILVICKFKK